MLVAPRVLILNHEREFAAVALGLDALERDMRRDGTRLPGKAAAVRDAARVLAELCRRDGDQPQAETTSASHDETAPVTLLTVTEVADRLQCSSSNITGLIRRGSLPARKIRGHWRVDVADLADYRQDPS